MYILFQNKKEPIEADVCILKEGVIRVSPKVPMLDNMSGFEIYSDRQMANKIGDYRQYRTRYKSMDGKGMYLSSGEVCADEETASTDEPTEEEIAAAEKRKQIELLRQQVKALKEELEESDYKIIKEYEYGLMEKDTEYDITTLHEERQRCRDTINTLESQMAELEERDAVTI